MSSGGGGIESIKQWKWEWEWEGERGGRGRGGGRDGGEWDTHTHSHTRTRTQRGAVKLGVGVGYLYRLPYQPFQAEVHCGVATLLRECGIVEQPVANPQQLDEPFQLTATSKDSLLQ